MTLKSFFIKEDPIFGLEISDNALRLGLIMPDKKSQSGIQLWLAEEPLASGVITGGLIKDDKRFLLTLSKLRSRAPKRVDYAIVSIEPNNVYSHAFPVPKTVREGRLDEAVRLALDFKLPIRTEESYLDWEKVAGKTEALDNNIHLQIVRRSVINQYLRLLTAGQVRAIAVEARPTSLARAMAISSEPILIIDQGHSWVHLTIVKDQVVQSKHSLTIKGDDPETLTSQIVGFLNYYESNKGTNKIKKAILLNKALENEVISNLLANTLQLAVSEPTIAPPWQNHPTVKPSPAKWVSILGVTERTLIPRSQDTLISLLPVGTEQAYTYHKIASFSKLVSNLIISFTLAIGLAFLGTWLFLNKIGEDMTVNTQVLSATNVGSDYANLEQRAKEFNLLISQAETAIKDMATWKPVLETLTTNIPAGVKLSRLNLPALDKPFSMNGAVNERATLSELRQWLENSGLFNNVTIPLTNLEQTENIIFTASFSLKKP